MPATWRANHPLRPRVTATVGGKAPSGLGTNALLAPYALFNVPAYYLFRAAQKAQIGFMVRTLLELTETPEADAADALAIGLTHFQMHSSPLSALRAIRPL